MSAVSALDLLFIHSWIDEAKLSANELRVLFHLVRRAGRNGMAYPGTRSIAEICGLRQNTVHAAIRELERRGFIVTEKRRGQVTIYRFPKLNVAPAVSETTPVATPSAEHPSTQNAAGDSIRIAPGDSIGIAPKKEVTQMGYRGDSIGSTKGSPYKVIQRGGGGEDSSSQTPPPPPQIRFTPEEKTSLRSEEEEVTKEKGGLRPRTTIEPRNNAEEELALPRKQNNLSDPSSPLEVPSANSVPGKAAGERNVGQPGEHNVIPVGERNVIQPSDAVDMMTNKILDQMRKDPLYKGIDLFKQSEKFKAHHDKEGLPYTQKRFKRWLGNIEEVQARKDRDGSTAADYSVRDHTKEGGRNGS